MSSELPSAVMRADQAFRDLGCDGDLIHISRETADTIDPPQLPQTPATAIAHTQMYEADGNPTLVIVAGPRSPDLTSLAGVLGVGHVTPIPDHVAHNWTKQNARAIAPVGHPTVVPVVIDVELSRHPRVWVPAGHPDYLMTTSYAELLRITAGTAAEIVDTPDAKSTALQ
jgi:prolyl-tRNA editing enzyme YbaK/EbsC (Cys-tRNA(Pro) deacylase)